MLMLESHRSSFWAEEEAGRAGGAAEFLNDEKRTQTGVGLTHLQVFTTGKC